MTYLAIRIESSTSILAPLKLAQELAALLAQCHSLTGDYQVVGGHFQEECDFKIETVSTKKLKELKGKSDENDQGSTGG